MEKYNSRERFEQQTKKICTNPFDNSVVGLTDEGIGYILSHNYVIAERILTFLPMRILNKCAVVCKLWNNVVRIEKSRRKDIFWMFKAKISPVQLLVDRNAIYFAESDFDVGAHFNEVLENARCEPKFCFLICEEIVADTPEAYFEDYLRTYNLRTRSQKKDSALKMSANPISYNEPLVQFLSAHLPLGCTVFGCIVRGFVVTPLDCSAPVIISGSRGFTSLFFPELPGLQTFQFYFQNEPISNRGVINEDYISFLTGIPKDVDVKCFLVFSESYFDRNCLGYFAIEHYVRKQKSRLALGGTGPIKVILPYAKIKDSRSSIAGVAFTGKNVDAASVVLEEWVQSPEETRNEIMKLKACNLPEKKCVAFMFAMECKMSFMQARIFHEIFPTVPVFGMFGYVQIGSNFLPNTTNEVENDILVKGYQATVFVLLTW